MGCWIPAETRATKNRNRGSAPPSPELAYCFAASASSGPYNQETPIEWSKDQERPGRGRCLQGLRCRSHEVTAEFMARSVISIPLSSIAWAILSAACPSPKGLRTVDIAP